MRNKKVVITITSIVAVLLVIIGVTYAYWLVTRTQTNENVISTGCLDISLNGEKNDITLTDQFPMSDEDGMKLVPYEFTVTNNCTTSVDFHINLESMGDSSTAIKASSLKAVIDENTPKRLYEYVGAEPTISGAYESYTLLYGTLAGSSEETTEDTATYELRIWIDQDAPISEQNKTFTSKISVSVGQNISSQGSTLASLILDDAEENNYLKTETPNFGTATADGEYGLYRAEDDLGTSYYFRGDVENNYVKFGKATNEKHYYEFVGYEDPDTLSGMYTLLYKTSEECYAKLEQEYSGGCYETEKTYLANEDLYWRIVRINGDGTIRMIYDGTTPVDNGVAHTAIIGKGNYSSQSDESKNLGYTFDNGAGVQADSQIKDLIDAWYENNFNSEYKKYIADSIFCNDKSYKIDAEGNEVYNTYERISQNKNPILICTNKYDRYSTDLVIGNGLLENPIGLITADEALFAGARGISNNYLYSGDNYWTMSTFYDSNTAIGYHIVESGGISSLSTSAGYYGVRPVINLKADVKFTGNGRIDTNTPYEIVMK